MTLVEYKRLLTTLYPRGGQRSGEYAPSSYVERVRRLLPHWPEEAIRHCLWHHFNDIVKRWA